MCNRPGEDAGHGENLEPLHLIYWMAERLCGQIAAIKSQLLNVSKEEVAFSILDRWGMPIVPWTKHTFKASLCHGPDHGIAMKLGVEAIAIKDFDPLIHINMARCTVDLDSITTNIGMWN
ncbi:hypothetical protein NW762_010497 [Fusarium torreyae]|uniref:Uncharacterized protein n=1 Tax=Fusarium torreyae TaxID=1237075 RepID=A0A9W8RUA9_9HYPO|nr:hypothetical protein NW762_010497 [Fusarium torreyae]